MPREVAIAVGAASRRWRIIQHAPRVMDPSDPSTWSLEVSGVEATVIDGVEVASQPFQSYFTGADVVDAMADAQSRVAALLALQAPNALYIGIREALYALLQAKGVIPAEAS